MGIKPKNAACIVLSGEIYNKSDLLGPSEVAGVLGNRKEDPDFESRRSSLTKILVSRKITPDNFLVGEDGNPRLNENGKLCLDGQYPKYFVTTWISLLTPTECHQAERYIDRRDLWQLIPVKKNTHDETKISQNKALHAIETLSQTTSFLSNELVDKLEPLFANLHQRQKNTHDDIQWIRSQLDTAFRNGSNSEKNSWAHFLNVRLPSSMSMHLETYFRPFIVWVGKRWKLFLACIAVPFVFSTTILAFQHFSTQTLYHLLRYDGPVDVLQFIYTHKIDMDDEKTGNELLIAIAATYHTQGDFIKGLDLIEGVLKNTSISELVRARASFLKYKLHLGLNEKDAAKDSLIQSQSAYQAANYIEAKVTLDLEWARMDFYEEAYEKCIEKLKDFETTHGQTYEQARLLMYCYEMQEKWTQSKDLAILLTMSVEPAYRADGLNAKALAQLRLGEFDACYLTLTEANAYITSHFGDAKHLRYNQFIFWQHSICTTGKSSRFLTVILQKWAESINNAAILETLERNDCP